MNSVGTAAIKKLGVICGFVVAGAKRDLSGSGGLCPFLWERPSADQVNKHARFPLSFDVNRYFKPCGMKLPRFDGHGNSNEKRERAFMNNQEPDLNPTPAETDSAKTNESVQRERAELPVDQRSSYLRSRQIALKKFSPQGGDPS